MSDFTPLVSWETILNDVQPVLAEQYFYTCKVSSVNPNDYSPGALGITDFYIADYTGRIYQVTEILDAGTGEVKIYDLIEDSINGPYIDENAYVYQSRAEANTLTQAQRKRLHPTAYDMILNIENNVIRRFYKYLQFDTTYVPSSEPEGLVWWNNNENTLNISTGYDTVLQVGQEIHIKVYNNSGSDILDGTAVYPTGSFNNFPTIGKAKTNTHENVSIDYGMTTSNVLNGGYGFVTWFGKVRGIDTSMFNLGDVLYISPTVAGEVVNVRPSLPNYTIQIGIVFKADVDGEIFITSRSSVTDTLLNFFNGTFRESFDFFIDSAGGVITGSLDPTDGHDDMTMVFSDGFTMLDTSPAQTVVLTPGTDTNPQTNYVYIPESTKTLTVSTSDWPITEHIKVCQSVLQSATTTLANGALRNQNWNDHMANTDTQQGHLAHVGERIRQLPASWYSGTEGTSTTGTSITLAATSGVVYQMHRQVFPALDMATGDDLHIVNSFTTPYKTVTDMISETTDALGNSLANSSCSFVLWGVANKSGEASHLMVNLPTGKYGKNNQSIAVQDPNNYSVFTIPDQFKGVGFLIARFTYSIEASGTTWALYETEDLRGFLPNSSAGGGAGGTGVTTYLGLTDVPNTYVALAFQRVNTGATALENVLASAIDVSEFNDDDTYVTTTGNETIAGIKTFSSFGITPSSAPTTDYQWANKKYVDDSGGGGLIGVTDIDDTFLGVGAGDSNTSGSKNTFIGYQAGFTNSTSGGNTFIGYKSGTLSTGLSSTFLGFESGFSSTGGDANVYLGGQSGYSGTNADNNVYIGYQSGYSNIGGDRNIFIGYRSGYNETGSDKLYIENSTSSSPLIYGEFDNNLVKINGTLDVNGGYIGSIVTKIIDYTVLPSDYTILADATSNTVDITLPASPNQGQIFNIKCINATFTCRIMRNSNNIEGAASDITLLVLDSWTVQYDSTFGWGRL